MQETENTQGEAGSADARTENYWKCKDSFDAARHNSQPNCTSICQRSCKFPFIEKFMFLILYFICFQHALKRMQSTFFGQKHAFNPMEDATPIEQLAQKYDTSLFSFCSDNKKRPSNVILGKSFKLQINLRAYLATRNFSFPNKRRRKLCCFSLYR